MAASAEFKVILTIDSQGNAKIEEVKRSLENMGTTAAQSGQAGAAGADNFAKSLGKVGASTQDVVTQLGSVVGITLSIAGAAYLAEKAFSAWMGLITGGISAVEDYRSSIISAAAMLTSMTDAKITPDMGKAYGEWKEYFQWLWVESIEADKKVAASQREIFETAKELAKKNVVALNQEHMLIAGRLTDFMKSVSPMMAGGDGTARNLMQVKSEIEALVTGQVRLTAQTAVAFKQIDENFAKNIKRARELGTVWEYLDGLLQGQKQSTDDMAKTWGSVSASLHSTWQQLQIRAFGNAYDDLVQYGQRLMSTLIQGGELTERGKLLADAMGNAWSEAKGKVAGLLDYIIDHAPEAITNVKTVASSVATIGGAAAGAVKEISQIISQLKDLANNPLTWAVLGGAAGARFGPLGAAVGATVGLVGGAAVQTRAYLNMTQGQQAEPPKQQAVKAAGTELLGRYGISEKALSGAGVGSSAPPAPPTLPWTDKPEKGGGGGGGGGRNTETLENLIMQLHQEQAKLADGAFGGIDAWYVKIGEKIRKLATDDRQLKEGMEAATALKTAKEQKVSDDLNKWYLGQMHQTTAAQLKEDEKKLASVKGHAAEEGKVREVMALHAQERADKLALAENQQQKTYYDSLASASLLIKDQVAWKDQSWQLEKKISQAQQEQWFIGKDLTGSQKDNYRALLALTNQAKEYNLARQKAVDLGTLEGWAIERAGEAKKRDKTSVKDMLSGAESFIQDAFSQGIQGALSGQKKSFKEVGVTIVQAMALELNKKSFTKIWDNIAKLLAPKPQSTFGGIGGSTGSGVSSLSQINQLNKEAAAGSVQAAKLLNESAENLTGSAGGLSGSAGGLTGAADAHTNAAGMSGISAAQLGLSAGGLLLSGIGVATGAKELVYAGMVLQTAALLLEISAAIGIFHGGGIVAHSGLLVAHGGLNLDERLVKAQVGEGIIKRDTMAEYARAGITFDMLNSGRLPVAPLPVAAGGQGGGVIHDNKQVHFKIGDLHFHPTQNMTDLQAEQMVRRQILPAIEKVVGNRGLSLLG